MHELKIRVEYADYPNVFAEKTITVLIGSSSEPESSSESSSGRQGSITEAQESYQQTVDDIVDAIKRPPRLFPRPNEIVTINAGEAFFVNIGEPFSPNGNEVEVHVDLRRTPFAQYDENSRILNIQEGYTTNNEAGVYLVKITLLDIIDDIEKEYEIKLIIL